ncbi:MAG TPA: hypothetical protein VFW50_42810 [Streptosporangiaceae bacterium]|nr:hypothetical protein [Streptosporangiaceae bacterium]
MRNATYAAARPARARQARCAVALLLAGWAGSVLLAGCAGRGAASPAVPAAAQSVAGTAAGQGSAGQGSAARAAALHQAAQCIRQHGIPSYADPVLTSGGRVYSDSRSIQDAPQAALSAVQQACGALAASAGLSAADEPPAPPQLVQAGVRAAQCMRAHGLPNDADPSARTPYTPGHGFGMTASEVPAGGKASPVFQRAAQACRALLDAEITASTLTSLGHDG